MSDINQRENEGALSDPLVNMIRDSGNGKSCEITLDKKWLELHGYRVGDMRNTLLSPPLYIGQGCYT